MRIIWWGYAFVVLDFQMQLRGGSVDVLPDALGYILLLVGMISMIGKEPCTEIPFKKGKWYAAVLIASEMAYSVFGWYIGGNSGKFLVKAITLLLFVFFVLCVRQTVVGIVEIEKTYKKDMSGDLLIQSMSLLVAVKVLSLALSLIPILSGDLVVIARVAAELVASCLFLFRLYYTSRQYLVMKSGK